MKKKLIGIGILLGVALTLILGGAYVVQTSFHAPYILLRTVTDEDTAIDLTSEGDFANKPAAAIKFGTADTGAGRENTIVLAFCGGDSANDTFTYKVYVWRSTNGPAEPVCTGTGTLGTQAVVLYPHNFSTATSKFWADTLTVTARWLKGVKTTDSSGNNEMAKIAFDGCGVEWLYVEITNIDGTGEATDISIYRSFM